jgi:uncharacterized OB-fold protein
MSKYQKKLKLFTNDARLSAYCGSVLGPCKEVCETCKNSTETRVKEMIEAEVSKSKRYLDSWGFEVKELVE